MPQDIPYAYPPDTATVTVDDIFQVLQNSRETRACWLCRYWSEERDDPRQPRWGNCLRMATNPPPLMFPMSEDPTMGTRLMTHPKFYCSEFDGE